MTTRMTGALLAAGFALLAAQPADAASVTPYGGYTAEVRPVVLSVAKDGRQIKLARTALDITCTDGSTDFTPDAWQSVPLSKSGAFKATFADVKGTSPDNKPMVSSGAFAGKVNRRRGTASGTWSLESRITQPDGSVVTCRSGSVRFKAAARGTRKPLVQGFFGAFSSADYPLVVEIAKTGRTVKSARGAFELKCSKGGYRFVADGWVDLPITAKGKFKLAVDDVEERFSDGTPYKIDSSISGSVDRSGRRLTGTWSVRWEIPEADGVVDICESGPVRFTVKR